MANETRRSKKTRERLIQVALQALAKNGVHDVSLQMIAKESGFDRSLVAYHFKDRNQIFLEVWNHVYGLAVSETEARTNISGSSREKLENYFRVSVQFFTSNRDITTLYFQLHYLAAFEPSLCEVNTQVKQVAIQRLARLILDGQAKGEFHRELDPHLTAKMIHSSLVGIIINSITEFQTFPLSDILATFTQQQLRAILTVESK